MSIRRMACALVLAALAVTVPAAGQPPPTVASDPRVVSALELARTWLADRLRQEPQPVSTACENPDQLTTSGSPPLQNDGPFNATAPEKLDPVFMLPDAFIHPHPNDSSPVGH